MDKARLTGYFWSGKIVKFIVACAFSHDILKPASTLCKALQNDEICVITAVEAVTKVVKAIEDLKKLHLRSFPLLEDQQQHFNHRGDVSSYQAVELVNY